MQPYSAAFIGVGISCYLPQACCWPRLGLLRPIATDFYQGSFVTRVARFLIADHWVQQKQVFQEAATPWAPITLLSRQQQFSAAVEKLSKQRKSSSNFFYRTASSKGQERANPAEGSPSSPADATAKVHSSSSNSTSSCKDLTRSAAAEQDLAAGTLAVSPEPQGTSAGMSRGKEAMGVAAGGAKLPTAPTAIPFTVVAAAATAAKHPPGAGAPGAAGQLVGGHHCSRQRLCNKGCCCSLCR